MRKWGKKLVILDEKDAITPWLALYMQIAENWRFSDIITFFVHQFCR